MVDRSHLPSLGPAPSFRFPRIHKHQLPSGLRVWTVEHRAVPTLAILLLVPAGSAADPANRAGLAALTADMLDEGSGARSAIEMHELLARIGAQFDTEVGADATILSMTVLSRFKERALSLLADMIVHARLDQADFDRVRDLRINRLVQLRDVPAAVADRAFAQVLYPGHPYGHLASGTESALRDTSVDEVRRFHRMAFLAERSTLIAVGDASHRELGAAAEQAFAEWRRSSETVVATPAPARAGPPARHVVLDAASIAAPARPAARLAVVDRPGATQSELRLGQVATSRNTPDYHALLVLNAILGGQFVSRINLNLREHKGVTYGARTSFDFRRGAGPFVLQVSVQTDATATAIHEALEEVRAIRGTRPATEDELDLARAALTRGYPRSFETAGQIARALAQLALYELPDDYFERFVPSVAAVSAAAVTEAASTYLDPEGMATVIVGDRTAVEPGLAVLGLGTPSVLPVL